MSIAMERFGSKEPVLEAVASGGLQIQAYPYRLQCRECGFEPVDAMALPPRCMKCGGNSWEQFASPGSLLVSADRIAAEDQREGRIVLR
jgi:hypothetical protein